LRSARPKPQSGAACGASKARSGRQVFGSGLVGVAAEALLGSIHVSGAEPGAQLATAIAHPNAQRIESEDIQHSWRIAVRSAVLRDTKSERHNNSVVRHKTQIIAGTGSIATTMRKPGEYSPLARHAHRTTNLVPQWRLGRRPSVMTMNLKFELPSNKNGKSILNRPWMMNLCPNPKRGDGRETSERRRGAVDGRKALSAAAFCLSLRGGSGVEAVGDAQGDGTSVAEGDRESSHDPGQRTWARPSVWPSSTIEVARKRPSKPINATANQRTQRYDNHAS
jgi:hypothetical protein